MHAKAEGERARSQKLSAQNDEGEVVAIIKGDAPAFLEGLLLEDRGGLIERLVENNCG